MGHEEFNHEPTIKWTWCHLVALTTLRKRSFIHQKIVISPLSAPTVVSAQAGKGQGPRESAWRDQAGWLPAAPETSGDSDLSPTGTASPA